MWQEQPEKSWKPKLAEASSPPDFEITDPQLIVGVRPQAPAAPGASTLGGLFYTSAKAVTPTNAMRASCPALLLKGTPDYIRA